MPKLESYALQKFLLCLKSLALYVSHINLPTYYR